MKKNVLLVVDGADGGGGSASDMAAVIAQIEALGARVLVVEKSTDLAALAKWVAKLETSITRLNGIDDKIAELELKIETFPEPIEARVADRPEIKTEAQLLKAELAQLENDPEPRIERKVAGGMKRSDAIVTIEKRKDYIRRALGIGAKVASGAKRAAAILVALATMVSLTVAALPARADQQGYPQAFVSMTNLPAAIAANASSNLLTAGMTNEVIIHRGAGLGLQWQFNTDPTALATNCALIIVPSIDGTNMDSYQQWNLPAKSNGSSVVTATTNWNANQLAGYKALFIAQETNGCSKPLTNNGVLWNVPQGGP